MNKAIKYTISMQDFLAITYVWQVEFEPKLRQIQRELGVCANARLKEKWLHYDAYTEFLNAFINKKIEHVSYKNKSVIRCMLMTAVNLIPFSKPPPAIVVNDPSVGNTFINSVDAALLIKPPSMDANKKAKIIIKDLLSVNKAGQPIYDINYSLSPIMSVYFTAPLHLIKYL